MGAAVEQLLGDRAVLSQYQVFNRTPGSLGTGGANKANIGAGVHYDYKPWRGVGSFFNWLFVVIPLVDYTDESGPLLAAEGSHVLTKVLESDGRVHQVDCACVPDASEAARTLVDPHLKRGDVMLMHGWCWHEAWPNGGQQDRAGIYMKFHALTSPPAVGPIIHPSVARTYCRPESRDTVLRYHRGDGKCAGIRCKSDDPSGKSIEPIPTIDSAALIIERSDGRIFAV